MQEEPQLRGPLRFGVFEVDLKAGELRKHGLRIRLQEQPFKVLVTLLERQGEVVTREELQKRLWATDTLVDLDHGLNKVINKIREALGDSAESPRFVETVARRGYRFLADVKTSDAAAIHSSEPATRLPLTVEFPAVEAHHHAPSAVEPANHKSLLPFFPWLPLRWRVVAALVSLAVLAALAAWRLRSANHSLPAIHSLAVLPLESLSADSSQNYFADGMTDELISDLGQISALRVISRTTVMVYRHVHKPLPQIARELNVDAVVEGTVLRSGDHVRITAQLIEASTDKHLWSESYQGELQDTLALQDQVARAIADQIRITVNPRERLALSSAKIVNPEAYQSYLKGRYFWNKRTSDGLKVALAYFNQAIEEDPRYARAYAGLADTYALLGDWQYAAMTPKEALPKAKAAAIKALELDSTLGEAHNSLAFCLDGYDWNLEAGGREFRRAIELNPGSASAHHWYAWHLSLLGRYDEAISEMRNAENLDPLSLIISSDLSELLILARSYEQSVKQSQRTIEMDPNFGPAHNQLGQAYLQQHMTEEAVPELQKAVQLSKGSSACIANLARAYVAAGDRQEAVKLLNGLKARSNSSYSNASDIAVIYAALGDIDQAMNWIEKGYEQRFNPGVLLRPGFDPLRSDPRFEEIVRRIGLPL